MTALDGFQVYDFFRAGSRRVREARVRIDRINVFPVPDGDTGTNLASTLSGAIAATVPAASAADTLGSLAEASILSARGNSGVIFAQFVSGLSEAVADAEMRTGDFAAGVRQAYLRARSAVSEPRTGTILSVIEDWAASLARRVHEAATFAELIGGTREDLRRSLAETTDRLPALKSAGVVDAGAAGFVEFVEGAHDYLVRGIGAVGEDAGEGIELFDGAPESAPSAPPTFRYCTEAIVSAPGGAPDPESLRAALAGSGDCLIVAAGKRSAKIHVHTDDPASVMEMLSRFGTVSGQKADDMVLQYRDAHERASRTAIVTDSCCDLPPDLMEKHRIHAVPLLIRADGSEFLDKLTLDAPRLRALSEGAGEFPRTSQPPEPFFSRLFMNLSSHYEGVVAIHLSGALSGTCAASGRAAMNAGGAVSVVDSRTLSGALGLLVLRAAEAASAGATREEIASRLDGWAAKTRILVSVTSLRYMVKGGRVSPLKGWIAKALNLKPIVSVDGAGKSILYGKGFSEAGNIRNIVRMVAAGHAEAPLRNYAVGHSGAPGKAAALAAELERVLGFPPRYVTEISAAVALNAGSGAVSVATMAE